MKTRAATFSLGKNNKEKEKKKKKKKKPPQNDNEEEEEDFEFAVLSEPEPQFCPITADDIFYNGQIRPFYPLFNTKLLLDDQESLPKSKTATNSAQATKKPNRMPLRKLFYEDRETFSAWNLLRVDAKEGRGSPGSCKKSSSTGSNSKRWKLKDLLHRSNSDGKDTFVFLMPSNRRSGRHRQRSGNDDHGGNNSKQGIEKTKEVKGAGGGLSPFQEHYHVRSKDGDKRRSYLPYRPDLVGFLSNVNGVGRNFHPF
uniref:DUF1645 domain-containing protein n=1 Tax=Salix viminalis TaxID=40686 RepID=A0A6N2LAY4_SALVM